MINEELTQNDIENEYQAQQLNEYHKRELLEKRREEYRKSLMEKSNKYHQEYHKLWLSHLKKTRE